MITKKKHFYFKAFLVVYVTFHHSVVGKYEYPITNLERKSKTEACLSPHNMGNCSKKNTLRIYGESWENLARTEQGT